MLVKLDTQIQRDYTGSLYQTQTWTQVDKNLNIRPEVIKPWGENVEVYYHDICFGNYFMGMILNIPSTKVNIEKMEHIEWKRFTQQRTQSD